MTVNRSLALWTLALVLAIRAPAPAQSLTEVLARARQVAGRLAPFECGFEAWDYAGLEPVKRSGTLQFRAPDQSRLVVEPGLGLPGGRVVLTGGNLTLTRVPDSGRVLRTYRNLFTDWANGFAGPANFASFGLQADALTRDYSILVQPGAPHEGRPTTVLTLTELRPASRLVKDHVDAGGEDIQIAYLVYKRRLYLRPPRVRLTMDLERWLILKREQFNAPDAGARATRIDTLLSARDLGGGLWFPERYETRNAEGALLASYLYRAIKPAAPLEASQFALTLAGDELAEDAELLSLEAYRQQLDQREKSASLNLGLYYMQWQEDPLEALKWFDGTEQTHPNAAAPRALRAQLFMATGRYAEAAAEWARVRQLRPNYPGVHALLARAHLADRNRSAAIAAFTAQLERSPDDAPLRLALGELMMQSGDYDRAMAAFRQALAPATPSLLGRLQAADDLLVAARWRGMLGTLATSAAGEDPVFTKLRGDALLFGDDPRGALAEYARLPARPETATVRYAAAQTLERAGQLDEARRFYEELARQCAGTVLGVSALQRLLALEAAAGRVDPALAILHRLIDNEPSMAVRLRQRSFFLSYFQKTLNVERMITALEPKVRATPPDELAALILVDAYPLIGQGDKALELIRSGPTRFPRSAWWHSRYASLLVHEARDKFFGDFSNPQRLAMLRTARDAADRAIAADPNLYYEAQRVFIYDSARTPAAREQAQAAAREVLRKYPNDSDANMVRAVLERTRPGIENPNPLAFYRQVLDVGTPYEDRHLELYFLRQSLADAYKRAGRYNEAYQQLFLLLDTSRSPSERAQIASAMVLTAGSQRNQAQAVGALADLLVRLMRRKEPKVAREAVLKEVLDPVQFETLSGSKELRGLVQGELGRRLQMQANDPYLNLLVGRLMLAEPNVEGTALEQAGELHERAADAGGGSDPDLEAWLAEAWALRKAWSGAAERMERAVERDPVRLADYFTLSNLYAQTRRLNAAAAVPRRVLLTHPNDTVTLRAAGSLFLKHLGRFDEAVKLYREAHRLSLLDPQFGAFDTVDLLVYLARAEALNGNFADAEQRFRLLAERAELGKPARIDAYGLLAGLYFDAKRYDDSLAALKQAKTLEPAPEIAKEIDERIKRVEAAKAGG